MSVIVLSAGLITVVKTACREAFFVKRYCNADNIFTMYFLTKSPNRDKLILAGVFILSVGYVSVCVYIMKEVFLMAEDFVGVSGSLNESFVSAANDKLFEVPFEALEVRMAKEKPQLVPGLTALKKAMSAPAFERLISPLLNINLGDDALLLVAGDERVRTELIGKYLPVIKAAFNVSNVRVVGGARNGLDAY